VGADAAGDRCPDDGKRAWPFVSALLDHLAWLGAGISGVAFVLVYFVARYWGSLLPYLAEFGVAADDHAGMRTVCFTCQIFSARPPVDSYGVRAYGSSQLNCTRFGAGRR